MSKVLVQSISLYEDLISFGTTEVKMQAESLHGLHKVANVLEGVDFCNYYFYSGFSMGVVLYL